MNQIVNEWLDRAYSDLRSAKYLFNELYPKELEVCCNLCSQCAEKSIKAIIVLHGDDVPKTHDIAFLLSQIKNYVTITDAVSNHGPLLTQYSIIARYPNKLDIDDIHGKFAIQYAEEIYNWAKAIVKEEN